MPIWVQWILAAITVVSAGWSVWAFLNRWRQKAVDQVRSEERDKQLVMLLRSLQLTLAFCNEACETKRVIKTGPELEFVSKIGHDLVDAQDAVKLMLGQIQIVRHDGQH